MQLLRVAVVESRKIVVVVLVRVHQVSLRLLGRHQVRERVAFPNVKPKLVALSIVHVRRAAHLRLRHV